MEFIIWIIFGGIIGWVASIFMHTDAEQGIMLNVVVGIIGAVLGGWLFNAFGATGVTGINLYSFAVAIIGSIILLAAVRVLRGAF